MKKLGFIGVGNMGEAVLKGVISSQKVAKENIFARNYSFQNCFPHITNTDKTKFFHIDLLLYFLVFENVQTILHSLSIISYLTVLILTY